MPLKHTLWKVYQPVRLAFYSALFHLSFRYLFPLSVQSPGINVTGPPYIWVGNHTGFLDGPMVATSLARLKHPLPVFLVAEEVLDWPLVGWILARFEVIALNQAYPRKGLQQALQALKSGKSICLFPEGKLSETGDMNAFMPGVSWLQEKSQAPLLPFALLGSYEAWPWGQKWPCPRPVCFAMGDALPYIAHDSPLNKVEQKAAQKALAQTLQKRIAALQRASF
jgi:1-acyl-sn-glycerol-3-phosphate acyltransferase